MTNNKFSGSYYVNFKLPKVVFNDRLISLSQSLNLADISGIDIGLLAANIVDSSIAYRATRLLENTLSLANDATIQNRIISAFDSVKKDLSSDSYVLAQRLDRIFQDLKISLQCRYIRRYLDEWIPYLLPSIDMTDTKLAELKVWWRATLMQSLFNLVTIAQSRVIHQVVESTRGGM